MREGFWSTTLEQISTNHWYVRVWSASGTIHGLYSLYTTYNPIPLYKRINEFRLLRFCGSPCSKGSIQEKKKKDSVYSAGMIPDLPHSKDLTRKTPVKNVLIFLFEQCHLFFTFSYLIRNPCSLNMNHTLPNLNLYAA